jgi:hypothetical protein
MKLAATASGVNEYYTGYRIVVKRLDTVTGREFVQDREIIAYDATNKVITIDSIWDEDFIPGTGDTYEIVPMYPDSRVSINTAMQAMDYITSDRYGRGLSPTKDLKLDTWLEAGRICDTPSDIWIKVTSGIASVGQVFRWPASGTLIWQGTVAEVDGSFVRMTNNIGKLTRKWNNWRNFVSGELVYEDNRLYISTGGVVTTKPIHSSGTVGSLSYRGTSTVFITRIDGAATLTLVVDGNPIRYEKNGNYVSGYTLYDSDGVDYWRHLGWDAQEQRYVTRHQTNITIDTSLPLFDNMNSILDHCSGILRYSGDKYVLEIEQAEGEIANSKSEPRNITADHIIGKIRLNDEGVRGAYNSLTVSFADPANKFEARNISFFNSDYLKADRNVPKKGNVSIPGITNYYNARILADRYLNRSRYGLTVSMNLIPRGVLLQAGKVIQLQYSRYGWSNKKFRIENLQHNEDCTVDIVAKEYDDSFYVISNISRPPATSTSGDANNTTPNSPYGLVASNISSNNENISGIELSWTNSTHANATLVTTEVFSSTNNLLRITVNTIAGDTLTSTVAHGLALNDTVTSEWAYNRLEHSKTYFVVSVPTATTFKLSETRGGAPLTFTSGSGLGATFLTATMIGTVTPPENSYIDVYTGNALDRVTKYYWIRHKVVQD